MIQELQDLADGFANEKRHLLIDELNSSQS